MSMLTVERETERANLLGRKSQLVAEKQEAQVELTSLRNAVRSGGRMPGHKYKEVCDAQNEQCRKLAEAERGIAEINQELVRLQLEDKHDWVSRHSNDLPPDPGIVKELVALRQKYHDFAADSTRVSSMRQMAAEFANALNPVIRKAVNSGREMP